MGAVMLSAISLSMRPASGLERAAAAERYARVVDQQGYRGIAFDSLGDARHRGAIGQVGGEHLDVAPGPGAQPPGLRLEPARAARDEDQIVPTACKLFGISGADSCGSAGDEGSAPLVAGHDMLISLRLAIESLAFH